MGTAVVLLTVSLAAGWLARGSCARELVASNATSGTQDTMDNSADKLVKTLLGRLSGADTASSLDTQVDDTMLGKPGHFAMPPQARAMSFPTSRAARPLGLQGRDLSNVIAQGLAQSKAAESAMPRAKSNAPVVPEIVPPSADLAELHVLAGGRSPQPKQDRQIWELMAVSNDALNQKQYLSALAFAVGAVTLLHAPEAHAAGAAAISPGVDWGAILSKASGKALGGGKAGATAAVVQVISLMWLRTAMNYQYRYGGNLGDALKTLMGEGGIGRLYQGLPFALVQGPLSRFGDTATNVGVLALFDALPEASGVPGPLRTAAASVAAGAFRIFCTPIDTAKTAMQVEGSEGLGRLGQRILSQGPAPLYQGSIASAVATFAGNYPWFLTYNTLDGALPPVSKEDVLLTLIRNAFLGLSASCVSDTVSNSLRVIKTTQQTAALSEKKDGEERGGISIAEALSIVLEQDGLKGLFGRGLKTRLLTNAIQGSIFSVLWRYFQTAGIR